MKILYLSFYFEPDLCAGSFRNSPLAKELSRQGGDECSIDVVTSQPNRYNTFKIEAEAKEAIGNITIYRISLPSHKSGMMDQVHSFRKYFSDALKITKGKKYDLVFASSSRLFTAYLGFVIARKQQVPLYLDIRDIFVDTMDDVLKNRLLKTLVMPFLKMVERRTFSYAHHINLISEGFKPYFAKYSQANFSYFTNGIDDIFLQSSLPGQTTTPKTDQEPSATDSTGTGILTPPTQTNIQSLKNNTSWPHDNTQSTQNYIQSLDTNTQSPRDISYDKDQKTFTITYAGNIGEGQGLHKIVPAAAARLGAKYRFRIVGDGGAKGVLEEELARQGATNVELIPPVSRDRLLEIYNESDFLFLHLNDYDAFKKVLPSKIFELATFDKPIIAGVGGYAHQFISDNVSNAILFNPCDVDAMVSGLENYHYVNETRTSFIEKFSRANINREMAKSILSYLEK